MRWLVLLSLAGCYSPSAHPGAPCSPEGTCPEGLACEQGTCVVPGGGPGEDASFDAQSDDAIDASTVVVDGCITFSAQFDTCQLPDGAALVLDARSYTYNTDTHELRDGNNVVVPVTSRVVTGGAGPIDVLVASSVTVSSSTVVRAVGSIPFGIVARGSMAISGVIDVSVGGAGARDSLACGAQAGEAVAVNHSRGPGGAGGGAFHGRGGRGGDGDLNEMPHAGVPGGTAATPPEGPLGGCPGGAGGRGIEAGGAGGAGGGAMLLTAQASLTVTGILVAGGGGGGGGKANTGSGGGGGSGGSIWLEAPTLALPGVLAANGGGGGEGADDSGHSGDSGDPGRANATPSVGGNSGAINEGGDGGSGSAATQLAGVDAPNVSDDAGGGGGGGAGFILLRGSVSSIGAISPPP